MKKQSLVLTLAALACTAAFAQAPTGVVATPSAQANPTASGGTPAAKAEMKVDAKLNNTAMNSMDTNGDGMVSSREWNRYQTAMWKSMKPAKNGMVPMTDVEMMMGTPK